MNILIIGGGGFIGQKLAARLAARGRLRGQEIASVTLADLTVPAPVEAPFPVQCLACDITDAEAVDALIGPEVDVIWHLAAVVSAHAEADLDAGMQVNLFGTLNLLERCRELGTCPVLVFASSLAVFGGDVPDPIEDWTIPQPQSSYGTQKAMGELLVNDFSRRGLIDGRGFRLPTIAVRPGKPNRAASSFMSSIIREPLNGQEAICPVGRDFPHYYLSPRSCVENLILGAELEAGRLGKSRCMTMPGLTATIGEMVDAMTAVAGPAPAQRIVWQDQPEIRAIVEGWRFDYRPAKALSLGLTAETDFAENVRIYIEDELGGVVPA